MYFISYLFITVNINKEQESIEDAKNYRPQTYFKSFITQRDCRLK